MSFRIIDLDALEALERAATPGPWFNDSYGHIFSKPLCDEHERLVNAIPDDAAEDDPRWKALPDYNVMSAHRPGAESDLDFAAAMRNAAPEIFESLRALTAERDALRASLAESQRTTLEMSRSVATHQSEIVALRAERDKLRAAAKQAYDSLRWDEHQHGPVAEDILKAALGEEAKT